MPDIGLREAWQMNFPPKPSLTEANLEDQTGKVFLVTGASSGCGEQLAKILFQHNAKVYVAARSREKATKAIDGIKKAHPNFKGELVFLTLDLNDLNIIKQSALDFTSVEPKLDALWLNAGVMAPPQGSTTAQGHELQIGVNNIAHFLFLKYLEPVLKKTASTAPAGSVRVVWVSSGVVLMAPKPAIDFDNINYAKKDESAWTKYTRSKAGNILQAIESSRRLKDSGVICLSLNPGNLKTELQRHFPWIVHLFMDWLLYHPRYGAYTELSAGLSSEINMENTGGFLQPWGRKARLRSDLEDPELARKYWEYCEEQVKDYYS
ncbi:hypothetical protein MMC10_002964 [Thelotrema lepadinum]|nr:hypothetical protein [Thelotrema lepadinum]